MTDISIPQPKPAPWLGNLPDIDPQTPIQSMMQLVREYGPLMRLDFPVGRVLMLSSQALANEVCDESRFAKKVHASLQQLRAIGGDGLFTAYNDEPNWGKAHRILMPAFGPMGLRDMFEPMLDIAEQMLTRWERFGAHVELDAAEQMTRLTLDTIALCGFDYRFNSFYRDDLHPFVDAMMSSLTEAGIRSRRPPFINKLRKKAARQFDKDTELLYGVSDQLIAERRKRPVDKPDLLNRMLEAVDPVTGERLSDENIRYQMVTFLIAGHETTSGLLSFALYFLLNNPEALRKAQAQVDAVMGESIPTLDHLSRLRHVEQILMETLRLWPTAPAFAVSPHEDTLLAGKYPVTPRDVLMVMLPMLHRDPAVWGDDADAFRPERFDPELEKALPPNAWKPFGNGMRACIGRPFAMQEAMLVLSMLLQRFDIEAVDPNYPLQIKETLTLKPEGFQIRVRRRNNQPQRWAGVVATPQEAPTAKTTAHAETSAKGVPLLVLYGSNTGSAEAFARRISEEAAHNGFAARCHSLDEQTGSLPTDGPVLLLSASYEGEPPDNARRFVDWLADQPADSLTGVRYAVFGCGNRQWASTYQAIPQKLDDCLQRAGAEALLPRAEADANADFFATFDDWYRGLWPTLAEACGIESVAQAPSISLQASSQSRCRALNQPQMQLAQVLDNRELVATANANSAPDGRKRNIQLALPDGMTYQTGDYLTVLPSNPPAQVQRVLRRFGLTADTRISADAVPGFWNATQSLGDLLSHYLELAQPVSRQQLQQLCAATRCPPEKAELEALLAPEVFQRELAQPRVSVLELLERVPGCELSLADYLAMLPPLRPRQYSISSAPAQHPGQCSLTLSVLQGKAWSAQDDFVGVASNWLAGLRPGDRLPVLVQASSFHPPAEVQQPIIMVAAGAGLAPFRGFIQQRAANWPEGQAPDLLFFGCRNPEADLLYSDELEAWQADGVISLHTAFSRRDGEYIQAVLWREREQVMDQLAAGASLYVCGEGEKMAPAVRDTLIRAWAEREGVDQAAAATWFAGLRERGRYAEDIFA
ncbi:bifunctional cytochrome P450/NADPH--P450 reductase [Halopseudomonas salegens]|uniref:Bifunctional cytochrome P450/NADPH--P450 reductase n=1 Tax=Halopseudomonas salegens TaxID=1434072 RepID=A0A1H2I0Y6_9GAMM|nr:cytochrome P450 [Halopseudomonas salegens]SDU37773.1 cytochrome P450 / NADPH-cytochrome P450 reductase [Halopseudomonas salegens]